MNYECPDRKIHLHFKATKAKFECMYQCEFGYRIFKVLKEIKINIFRNNTKKYYNSKYHRKSWSKKENPQLS